jgi:penicillin-binding protein 1A
MEPSAPEGVVNVGGEWYYDEYARGGGISTLGGGAPEAGAPDSGSPGSPYRTPEDKSLMNSDGLPPNRAPSDERRSILDLFRN